MKSSKSYIFVFFLLWCILGLNVFSFGDNSDATMLFSCPSHMYVILFGEFMEVPFDYLYTNENLWTCSFENEDLLVKIYYIEGEMSYIETAPVRGVFPHERFYRNLETDAIKPDYQLVDHHGYTVGDIISSMILIFEEKHLTLNAEGLVPFMHQIYQENEGRKVRIYHAYILCAALFALIFFVILYAVKIRKSTMLDNRAGKE